MPRSIRERALKELQHRAVAAGFRRGTVIVPEHIRQERAVRRAEILSRRAESVAGSRLIARDPHAHAGSSPVVIGVLAVGAGIAIGYAIGKWLKKKNATYLQGIDAQISSNRYLIGAAVLAQ